VSPLTIRASRKNSDEQAAEGRIWPCGYVAKCSVPWCRRRTTKILRYLDSGGRPYRQTDMCEPHARELCLEMKVIDRRP
jgi:hypothetical protein